MTTTLAYSIVILALVVGPLALAWSTRNHPERR